MCHIATSGFIFVCSQNFQAVPQYRHIYCHHCYFSNKEMGSDQLMWLAPGNTVVKQRHRVWSCWTQTLGSALLHTAPVTWYLWSCQQNASAVLWTFASHQTITHCFASVLYRLTLTGYDMSVLKWTIIIAPKRTEITFFFLLPKEATKRLIT